MRTTVTIPVRVEVEVRQGKDSDGDADSPYGIRHFVDHRLLGFTVSTAPDELLRLVSESIQDSDELDAAIASLPVESDDDGG